MAFTEDFGAYFQDFGESCTVAGIASTGIFDKGYLAELGVVSGNDPVLLIQDSSLGNAVYGSPVEIRGSNYLIREIQPDGTGLTRLQLELQ